MRVVVLIPPNPLGIILLLTFRSLSYVVLIPPNPLGIISSDEILSPKLVVPSRYNQQR